MSLDTTKPLSVSEVEAHIIRAQSADMLEPMSPANRNVKAFHEADADDICIEFWKSGSCHAIEICPKKHVYAPIPWQNQACGELCSVYRTTRKCPLKQDCPHTHVYANELGIAIPEDPRSRILCIKFLKNTCATTPCPYAHWTMSTNNPHNFPSSAASTPSRVGDHFRHSASASSLVGLSSSAVQPPISATLVPVIPPAGSQSQSGFSTPQTSPRGPIALSSTSTHLHHHHNHHAPQIGLLGSFPPPPPSVSLGGASSPANCAFVHHPSHHHMNVHLPAHQQQQLQAPPSILGWGIPPQISPLHSPALVPVLSDPFRLSPLPTTNNLPPHAVLTPTVGGATLNSVGGGAQKSGQSQAKKGGASGRGSAKGGNQQQQRGKQQQQDQSSKTLVAAEKSTTSNANAASVVVMAVPQQMVTPEQLHPISAQKRISPAKRSLQFTSSSGTSSLAVPSDLPAAAGAMTLPRPPQLILPPASPSQHQHQQPPPLPPVTSTAISTNGQPPAAAVAVAVSANATPASSISSFKSREWFLVDSPMFANTPAASVRGSSNSTTPSTRTTTNALPTPISTVENSTASASSARNSAPLPLPPSSSSSNQNENSKNRNSSDSNNQKRAKRGKQQKQPTATSDAPIPSDDHLLTMLQDIIQSNPTKPVPLSDVGVEFMRRSGGLKFKDQNTRRLQLHTFLPLFPSSFVITRLSPTEVFVDLQQQGKSRESGNLFHSPETYKTQLCVFHFSGTCARGPSCWFAHGMHELKPLAAAVGEIPKNSPIHDISKNSASFSENNIFSSGSSIYGSGKSDSSAKSDFSEKQFAKMDAEIIVKTILENCNTVQTTPKRTHYPLTKTHVLAISSILSRSPHTKDVEKSLNLLTFCLSQSEQFDLSSELISAAHVSGFRASDRSLHVLLLDMLSSKMNVERVNELFLRNVTLLEAQGQMPSMRSYTTLFLAFASSFTASKLTPLRNSFSIFKRMQKLSNDFATAQPKLTVGGGGSGSVEHHAEYNRIPTVVFRCLLQMCAVSGDLGRALTALIELCTVNMKIPDSHMLSNFLDSAFKFLQKEEARKSSVGSTDGGVAQQLAGQELHKFNVDTLREFAKRVDWPGLKEMISSAKTDDRDLALSFLKAIHMPDIAIDFSQIFETTSASGGSDQSQMSPGISCDFGPIRITCPTSTLTLNSSTPISLSLSQQTSTNIHVSVKARTLPPTLPTASTTNGFSTAGAALWCQSFASPEAVCLDGLSVTKSVNVGVYGGGGGSVEYDRDAQSTLTVLSVTCVSGPPEMIGATKEVSLRVAVADSSAECRPSAKVALVLCNDARGPSTTRYLSTFLSTFGSFDVVLSASASDHVSMVRKAHKLLETVGRASNVFVYFSGPIVRHHGDIFLLPPTPASSVDTPISVPELSLLSLNALLDRLCGSSVFVLVDADSEDASYGVSWFGADLSGNELLKSCAEFRPAQSWHGEAHVVLATTKRNLHDDEGKDPSLGMPFLSAHIPRLITTLSAPSEFRHLVGQLQKDCSGGNTKLEYFCS